MARAYWRVEISEEGGGWSHLWTGTARDLSAAVNRAQTALGRVSDGHWSQDPARLAEHLRVQRLNEAMAPEEGWLRPRWHPPSSKYL